MSNISACQVIAEAVRTTLGPRGMDKLIVDGRGKPTGSEACLQKSRGHLGVTEIGFKNFIAFSEGLLSLRWWNMVSGVASWVNVA